MNSVLWAWIISAVVITLIAGYIGSHNPKVRGNPLGMFVDGRGRYSLSQLQVILWNILIFSLMSGVFFGRLFAGKSSVQEIQIPDQIMILTGISLGSMVTSRFIKTSKDNRKDVQVLRSDKPQIDQLFFAEEGEPGVFDVTRFQNLVLTLLVFVVYLSMGIEYAQNQALLEVLPPLPNFNSTWTALVSISHAGYLAGKLPDKKESEQPEQPEQPVS